MPGTVESFRMIGCVLISACSQVSASSRSGTSSSISRQVQMAKRW